MEDVSSLANIADFKTNKFRLDLTADFNASTLSGTVELFVTTLTENSDRLVLDTRDLSVSSVSVDGKDSQFSLDHENSNPTFGTALHIILPQKPEVGKEFTVVIAYTTSPSSTAIQWLSPSQTAGKQHPFLFTQCQAIHARSLLPCQDSPGMKASYDASITVPRPLTAVMSAKSLHHSDGPTSDLVTYHFHQAVPMSTYLVAIAIGQIESCSTGSRTKLWAEPPTLEAARQEFEEFEQFLDALETFAGSYKWESPCCMLVLPPSFPYGGMENPCMTFVTPTLLSGDRSLVDVVIHELAHSWSGNLVTNRFWKDFWLNEGFTVYLERLVTGALYGEEARQFSAILGMKALTESLDHLGYDNPLTKLVPDLTGIDPDDAFSSVPYEKGFNFLYYLEQLVGKEVFLKFLKEYFAAFQYKGIETEDFKRFFLEFTSSSGVGPEILGKIEWDRWLNTPGLPIETNTFTSSLAQASHELADRIISGEKYTADDMKGWRATQVMEMLERLLEHSDSHPFTPDTCLHLDAAFGFTNSGNAEIRHRWLMLAVKSDYEGVTDSLVSFITSQGRMKFVRPLYRAMFKNERFQKLAVSTFETHRSFYHAIASKMIARDLKLE